MAQQKNGGKSKKPNFRRDRHFRNSKAGKRQRRLEATKIQQGKARRREEYSAQQR